MIPAQQARNLFSEFSIQNTNTMHSLLLRSRAVLSLLFSLVAIAVFLQGCASNGQAQHPPTLVSIAVTPVNPSVAAGNPEQFTATGTYSDNSTQNLSSVVTWTSGTPATATISTGGLATTLKAGTSLITATSGSISGNTTLTVAPKALVSIAVTPVNPSVALGLQQQFTATGTYTDNSTGNITTSVTWTSGTPATATISTGGLATTVAVGTSVITATSGSISGNTTLTVTVATLESIAVTPANPTIAQGVALQFTATGNYSDGSTGNITNAVGWSSTNTLVATINGSGLATAVGTGSATINVTGSGIVGSSALNVTASTAVSGLPAGRFVYAADSSNNVTGFAEGANGALSNLSGSPSYTGGSNPQTMAVDPSGKFVLVANISSSNVSVFSIDSVLGVLTPVSGSPFSAGTNPYAVAVHPSGKFVYVTNQFSQNITAYSLDAGTGALSAVSGSPFATNSNPEGLAIYPTGKYLYAATQDGSAQAYTVDAGTGALTPVGGSPFSLGGGSEVPSAVVDPSGRFLYVARATTNEVVAMSINASTGALTPVPGSPLSVGNNPLAITVDRTGNFVYVVNSSGNNITGYVIDTATGALLPMSGSPFSTGTTPNALAIDTANQFLYVANLGSQAVSAYSLNASTGALSAVSGSPFGGSGASAIAATAGPATPQTGISAIAGQNAGAVTENPVTNLTSLTFAHNVTAGNQIIVAEKIENYGAATAPSTPTKSSGTATIGPFTQDAANDGVYGSYYYSLRVWRAPITGSGTLTLSFPASAASWLVVAIDEFSGMAASPVDGTPVSNTGTGSTESTGNVVTSKAGMVLMLSSEYSSSNFTYTQSDTNIYTAGNGATGATGEAQYKLTNGAGTYNLTADNGVNNPFWLAVGVAYK
jgi:6-phosphogluconolactonase (cycloisomerase 2 family)